jgi:hypothetical protein
VRPLTKTVLLRSVDSTCAGVDRPREQCTCIEAARRSNVVTDKATLGAIWTLLSAIAASFALTTGRCAVCK